MTKTGAALVASAELVLGRPLDADEKPDVDRNMLVDEYLIFAESVRKKNELDSLVGITPAMLAFHEDESMCWNYYSYGNSGPLSLISTFALRDYASQAGRPFEAAVGMLIVGQLISTRNHLDFHEESRGCPLDFNENRDELIDGIRAMKFDGQCMSQIADPEEAKAARDLMNALRRMKGDSI